MLKRQYIFFFLLSLFTPTIYGEVCLPLERSLIELDSIHGFSNVKLSPVGTHLLYKNKQNSILLFDLETREATEFIHHKQIVEDMFGRKEAYDFSTKGSVAWALFQGRFMKVKNFLQKETHSLPLVSEEEMLVNTSLTEDRSKLFSVSFPEDFKEKADKLEEEVKGRPQEEVQKIYEEFMSKTSVNLNILDMNKLELTSHPGNLGIVAQCAVLRDDMIFVVVREDGSLYTQPLSDQGESPLELFGPIEGIQIISLAKELESVGKWANCLFLDHNTALIEDRAKEQYILRRVKEKEQYIIKADFLDSLYVRDFFDIFYYPYLIQSGGKGTWAYHIPTGQVQESKEHYMHVGKGGQFGIELVSLEEERKKIIKAVHQPFESSKRSVLLEMDLEEVKHISFNEDKSLSFIGTVFGDLFIVNVKTGYIKRHFFGQQFRGMKLSDSGNTFLLEHIEGDNISYKIHQIQEKCVQPLSFFSENLTNEFEKLRDIEDPAEDSFLAFLTGVLQEEEIVKTHSELIQALLWKVFLHYPNLYLDIYSRYSSLELLSPFPASLIESKKLEFQVREALLSILEMQTQFRHTKLFHWTFLRMLEPILSVLSEEEQDLYIEQITESLSNGATESIPLFQDVFQSKLFYVIYSHVKSWFGRNYKPVSDITIVRKKQAFLTLILSSEPIQNHPSIETNFGIHYAVVEDFSKALSPSEVEPGQELVNDLVGWSLLNGSSYRAHVQIDVQSQYQSEAFLITQNRGPDYESVWKDQKMTGLVIIGSSLRSFSKILLENYLSYFKEQGFLFTEIPVPDFQPFLTKKIGSCEIDYFLKESHSDGDERNVFRFDRVNSVLKGVRQTEGGQGEVVYLVFPKPFHFGKRETVLFSNLELAELIKQREEKGCGEITYFNTSCWSHVKARYEIETVHSPLLLNIPSRSTSDTFLNQEGDAIRQLVEAYRGGLNFDGFRKALEKNEGYKSGKVNQYLFPDERRYYNSVFEPISIPLRIQIDLERKEDGEWRTISPDEAL